MAEIETLAQHRDALASTRDVERGDSGRSKSVCCTNFERRVLRGHGMSASEMACLIVSDV